MRRLGNLYGHTGGSFAYCVYDSSSDAPSINTMGGGGRQPMIPDCVLIREATKTGYTRCRIGGVANMNYENSTTRRGRVIDEGNTAGTITTENNNLSVIESWRWEINGKKYRIRIRKLTPRECWRLMGFSDEDYDRASKVNSNTQLYKQAGNSIVVPVLEGIFRNIISCLSDNSADYKEEPKEGQLNFSEVFNW